MIKNEMEFLLNGFPGKNHKHLHYFDEYIIYIQ